MNTAPFAPIIWDRNKLTVLDQTLLPVKEEYVELKTETEVEDAIKRLVIRGAPLIGVGAALGIFVSMRGNPGTDLESFKKRLKTVCALIGASRPTAVNLAWAVERILKTASSAASVSQGLSLIQKEAELIYREDLQMCEQIGIHGAELIDDGDTILTHCNAGGLATSGFGTALSVIFKAHEQGKKIHVYADETRPLLQGARLTTWELMKRGVPCTLICDNMAGFLMKQGKINKIITGADRIALNGDSANKIGTYSLSKLARVHNIPFYIAAPNSTIDFSIAHGDQIPIEERRADEVRHIGIQQTAPLDVPVYNPAFEVTDAEDIHAIITEKAVFRAPYTKNIQEGYDL